MRILITGGNGFIARNVREQLCHKHDIDAPTRQELDLLDSNQVKNYLGSHQYDVIVHAANYDAVPSHYNKDPNKVLENNLRMFFNLENYRHDEYLINLGSGAEYSRDCWQPMMKEDYFGKCIPKDPYGLSKFICAKLTDHSDINESMIINLRLFAVFGKYEDWRVRYLSNAICRNIFGLPIKINQNRKFDFLHVDDFVSILDKIVYNHNRIGSSINICSSKVYDFITLAKMINDIGQGWGNNPVRLNIIESGEGLEYSGDNKIMLENIGEVEFTPIEESLKRLYLWYLEKKDTIDPNLL